MSRIMTTVLIALVLMNGAVTVMEGSGLAEDVGVTLAPGISERADSIVETMKGGFQPGTSVVASLLSIAISVGNLFLLVLQSAYAFPTALLNLGFPTWFVVPVFAPFYILGTLELALVVLGRRSV